jgi:hypothetical protein
LERLERKLFEKEREVQELRKMLGGEIEKLKRQIIEEITEELRKVRDVEAKVVELSKAVDTLMNEVLYLKSEVRKDERSEREIIDIMKAEEEKKEPENPRKEDVIVAESKYDGPKYCEEDGDIIFCD